MRQRTEQDLRRIQIVFQSQEQAHNPRMIVSHTLDPVLRLYHDTHTTQQRRRVKGLLELVELQPDLATKLPRQLPGGQRQRVAIARAFAAEPAIVLCDEFLSALDTLVAKRITALMAKLKSERGVSYVFVSHDLATVSDIADRVAIMLNGKIVETGHVRAIFREARHPYTRLLIRSIPQMRKDWIDGVDSASDEPSRTHSLAAGVCGFLNRCSVAIDGVCDRMPPPLQRTGSGHEWLCHRSDVETVRSIH